MANREGVVLVTGAAGFVGRSLCALLRRKGVAHIGIDREDCDIADRAVVTALVHRHRANTVIHLAAVLPTACRNNPELAMRVNIGGSVNVVDAAAGVEHFVFGSSMSVDGAEGIGLPLSEQAPPAPTDPYGAAKRYVEVYGAAKLPGFTALRIATVVGPGARNTASPWRSDLFERRTAAFPYSGDKILSLVHVDDIAEMLLLCALRKATGIYNTPAENWRVSDFKKALEACNVTVEIDMQSDRRTPPVSNGARFAEDFGYRAVPLIERLRILK